MDNRLVLAGRIAKREQTRYSPAGLPITRLVLEHFSQQTEAGFEREVRCSIPVVVCGEQLNRQADALIVNTPVRVTGFISRASHRHSASHLVLHAERIEVLES